jgi:xanthosine utilization system XapX-like protein
MIRLTALIAFVVLAAFLAILAIKVPSPDLVAVIVLTVLLVAYDFITSAKPRD